MIVNLKGHKREFILARTLNFFRKCYHDLFLRGSINRLFDDSEQLMMYFKNNYPEFKRDAMGNTSCTSCELCIKVCPTQALELKKANIVDFPSTLKTGEAPLHFYLDVSKCIKCHECANVCLVDALELNGRYKENRVDLAIFNRDQKVDLELDS